MTKSPTYASESLTWLPPAQYLFCCILLLWHICPTAAQRSRHNPAPSDRCSRTAPKLDFAFDTSKERSKDLHLQYLFCTESKAQSQPSSQLTTATFGFNSWKGNMIYWRQKRVLEELIITSTNKLTTEWLQSGQLLLLQPGLAAFCFLLLHYTIPVIQNVSSAFSDSTQAGLSYLMSTLVVLKPCWASRTHLFLCTCHLGLSGLNEERKHCADEWESCKDWRADQFD